MTNDDILSVFKADCPYPVRLIWDEGPHVFVTVDYEIKSGAVMQYTLALDRGGLDDAVDPAGLVRDHIEVVKADLALAKDASGPMPVWGG